MSCPILWVTFDSHNGDIWWMEVHNCNIIQLFFFSFLYSYHFFTLFKKSLSTSRSWKCSSFFPKICVALLFLFRYVIYQEWLFCLVWGKDHDSFFPIWKFNTLYRKARPAPLHFIVTFIVFWVTIYAWAYFWILFCPSSLLAYPCTNTILSELLQISTGLNTGSVSPLDFFEISPLNEKPGEITHYHHFCPTLSWQS